MTKFLPNRRRMATVRLSVGVLAVGLGLAACTAVSSSGSTTGSGSGTAGTTAKNLTVGLASEGLSSPFPVSIANGVKSVAAKDGIKPIVLDGKLTETTQESDIQTLIAEHVSGIIIDVIDPGPTTAMIKQAQAAGIPVMLVHGYAGSGPSPVYPGVAYEIDENEVKAGAQAGQLALAADPSGGQVAIITGTPGYVAVTQRQDGFESVITPTGKYHVVAVQSGDWTPTAAYSACSAIFQAHPKLSLIYSESDDMTLGCAKAEKAAGAKAAIVSIGGEAELKPLITDKQVYGTVCYEPETEGQTAMTAMAALLSGKAHYDRTLNFYSTPSVTAANMGACGWQW
jgi:ABC-type sugar transport system substrate-binding protein